MDWWKNGLFSAVILCLFTTSAAASPWLEPDDVYLRSNLQRLAEAGIITSSVNTFPLPWREIGQELKQTQPHTLSKELRVAYMHLRHALESAQLMRGQSGVKLKGATAATPSAFGQYNVSRWQTEGSYSMTERSFAFRANANYVYYHGESPEMNWDGGFLAVNLGDFSFVGGALHKWWGPGWQSSLALMPQGKPAPAGYITYSRNQIPVIDNIYIETGGAWLEDASPWEKGWLTRLATRPLPQVELGVTHAYYDGHSDNRGQSWLWREILGKQQETGHQTTLDLRLTPWINHARQLAITPSVYGQYRINDNLEQQNAYLVGIDGQTMVGDLLARFVVEYRHNPLADNRELNAMLTGLDELGRGKIVQLNSLSDQTSVGGYLQLANNHEISLFYHHEKFSQSYQRLATEYRLPLFNGLFSVALHASDADWQQDKVQLSSSWDYRF